MIVDLGGGTVDLISYRLIRLEPLQLEEACVGQGKSQNDVDASRTPTSANAAQVENVEALPSTEISTSF